MKSASAEKHDELVVAGLMLQQVDDVEHHVDVGAGLALAGDGRAIDDLEAGARNGVAVALVPVRVEVAAAHQQARRSPLVVGRREVPGIR